MPARGNRVVRAAGLGRPRGGPRASAGGGFASAAGEPTRPVRAALTGVLRPVPRMPRAGLTGLAARGYAGPLRRLHGTAGSRARRSAASGSTGPPEAGSGAPRGRVTPWRTDRQLNSRWGARGSAGRSMGIIQPISTPHPTETFVSHSDIDGDPRARPGGHCSPPGPVRRPRGMRRRCPPARWFPPAGRPTRHHGSAARAAAARAHGRAHGHTAGARRHGAGRTRQLPVRTTIPP